MSSPMDGIEERLSTAGAATSSEPGTPQASERAPNDQEEEEREHVREDYLSGVQRRIESYESCVSAITAATASLQELSTNLDTMKLATQQLNAFTGGWLAVWKRPS